MILAVRDFGLTTRPESRKDQRSPASERSAPSASEPAENISSSPSSSALEELAALRAADTTRLTTELSLKEDGDDSLRVTTGDGRLVGDVPSGTSRRLLFGGAAAAA